MVYLHPRIVHRDLKSQASWAVNGLAAAGKIAAAMWSHGRHADQLGTPTFPGVVLPCPHRLTSYPPLPYRRTCCLTRQAAPRCAILASRSSRTTRWCPARAGRRARLLTWRRRVSVGGVSFCVGGWPLERVVRLSAAAYVTAPPQPPCFHCPSCPAAFDGKRVNEKVCVGGQLPARCMHAAPRQRCSMLTPNLPHSKPSSLYPAGRRVFLCGAVLGDADGAGALAGAGGPHANHLPSGGHAPGQWGRFQSTYLFVLDSFSSSSKWRSCARWAGGAATSWQGFLHLTHCVRGCFEVVGA